MDTNKTFTNTMPWTNVQVRNGAFPLECYSIFATYAEAKEYALNNPVAYEGQVVAVAQDNTITVYVLDSSDKTDGLKKLVDETVLTEEFSKHLAAGVNYKVLADGTTHNNLDAADVKKGTIYLEKDTTSVAGDYTEWMVLDIIETEETNTETGEVETKYTITWEQIGSTKTDLSDYAKTTDVEKAIDDAIEALNLTPTEIDQIKQAASLVGGLAFDGEVTKDNPILTLSSLSNLTVDDISVEEGEGKLVTAVTQTDGKISVTKGKASWKTDISDLPSLPDTNPTAPEHHVLTGLSVTEGLITDIQTKQLTTDDISGFGTYVELSDLTAKLEGSEEAKYAKTPVSETNKLITNDDVEDILTQVKPVVGSKGDTVNVTVTETEEGYQVGAELVESYALDGHEHSLTEISNLADYTTRAVDTEDINKITISADVKVAIENAIDALDVDEVTGIITKIKQTDGKISTTVVPLSTYATSTDVSTMYDDIIDIFDDISSTVATTYLSASKFLDTLNTYTESAITVDEDGNVIDGTQLVNKNYVAEQIKSLGDVMHFRSAITANENETDIDAIERVIKDPVKGDVVLLVVSTKEYVYDGAAWIEIGDQNLYATKADLKAETDARIAADQFLSAAIDNKIFIDSVSATTLSIQHISQDAFHELVVKNELVSNELYIVSSDTLNMYGERIINLKDPEISSDAATKNYVDTLSANIFENKQLSVSQLIWDVELDGGNAKA